MSQTDRRKAADNIFAEVPVAIHDLTDGTTFIPEWSKLSWKQVSR